MRQPPKPRHTVPLSTLGRHVLPHGGCSDINAVQGSMSAAGARLATSVCQPRHDQIKQGPSHTLDAARSY